MSFIENRENELVYMTSSVIGVPHAFTTRYGGVSEGIFSSLNLGSNRGDDPDAVRENYRRVCALMGVGIDEAAVTKQVHGNVVRVVTGEDRHVCMSTVPYEADGLVTAERGLPLMCFTADCVPALLCDSVHNVIAAVHCGWRSSVADILGEAMAAMAALGAEASATAAAIGPAISRCCFEVGGEVIEAVEAYLGGDTAGLYAPSAAEGKFLLDLKAANARRLMQLGVPANSIAVSDECTFCRPEKYWSHRYTHGRRGNQGAIIVL